MSDEKETGEIGPVWGVKLLDCVPLTGVMMQALPCRQELERVRRTSERTVAAFEVLLAHYKAAKESHAAAVRAMATAFRELNEIRARDGVPWTRYGGPASVTPEAFSAVVDELDRVVQLLDGKSAHCHPSLYGNP